MSYEILPYVGVGKLRFGMSPSMVATMIGEPQFSCYDTDAGATTQYWHGNGLQLTFLKCSNSLASISMYSNISNVSLPGIALDWSRSKSTYESLMHLDPSAMTTVGITVFFKYGIAVSGFQNEDGGGKSITAFSEGQWTPEDPFLKQVR
ncbi:hypothetical protein [Stenotrophomonas sp.]|uniref:hypothetical protein n=1 Tax=Stenotrophomonas sp. TaxID=69392 RepID=UPI0029AF9A9B|nr:hypothetical protein [Stenotrophomonas sp.]MDX3933954.1 hypothetical protein [Stenotrophomonas sp.]